MEKRIVKITLKAYVDLRKADALSPNAIYIIVNTEGEQIATG